jgi:DNA topoisomerase-3
MTRYVTVSLREAGYNVKVISDGRVQTPTLGLVVSRDREIVNFSPLPYYELSAMLSLDRGRKLKGRWVPGGSYENSLDEHKRVISKETADVLVQKLAGVTGAITSVTKKKHNAAPPLPFSLSKLQMAASKKYDITDTLSVVQKLYEAGYVTYPRTDCEYIPEGHFTEAPKVMNTVRLSCPPLSDMWAGIDLSRKNSAWNSAKVEEHHAIIPTTKAPHEGTLSEKERKIYELVCARYVLQFLSEYEYEETTIDFEANKEVFRATGRTVINLGWQGWDRKDEPYGGSKREKTQKDEGDGEASDEDERDTPDILPSVRQGESGLVQAYAAEKTTKPPKPYSYHSLLAAMNGIHVYVKDPQIKAKLRELQGIGTAATQEGIISTLFDRGYIYRKKKEIFPTDLGKLLIDLLSERASALVYPDMTALWEGRMSDIEKGAPLESFVTEVAGMVREIISGSLDIPADIPGMERRKSSSGEIIDTPCPLGCGGSARRYEGKYGLFWKCSCSPGLTFKGVNGGPVVKEQQVEAKCPMPGCKGKAARLAGKKDGHLFWMCHVCGNFFDDIGGVPALRERGKKAR